MQLEPNGSTFWALVLESICILLSDNLMRMMIPMAMSTGEVWCYWGGWKKSEARCVVVVTVTHRGKNKNQKVITLLKTSYLFNDNNVFFLFLWPFYCLNHYSREVDHSKAHPFGEIKLRPKQDQSQGLNLT